MKNKKDISQNIKDNQHKLNRKPSDKAWEKLEGQLKDFQPKAKRRSLIAKWSIAASILAIIGIGAVVSNNLKSNNNQTAMNAPMKMTFEELHQVEVSPSEKEITETYRTAQKKVTINEGNITKKLVPSPAIVKTAEIASTPETLAAVEESVETISQESNIETSGLAKTIETDASEVIASKDLAMEDKKVELQLDDLSSKTKAAFKKDDVQKTKKAEKSKPVAKAPKAKYIMSSSLNDFKWIMGDWREIAGGNSSWNLSANDLLQNEDLRISLVGDKVFLDVPFEDYEGRYTLVSKSNGVFTFVRKGVVITIKKNGQGFDVVLNDHGFEQVTMRSYMK